MQMTQASYRFPYIFTDPEGPKGFEWKISGETSPPNEEFRKISTKISLCRFFPPKSTPTEDNDQSQELQGQILSFWPPILVLFGVITHISDLPGGQFKAVISNCDLSNVREEHATLNKNSI